MTLRELSLRLPALVAAVLIALITSMAEPALRAAKAAEAGVGVYLLGFRSGLAGIVRGKF
jgi:hypothetical protein